MKISGAIFDMDGTLLDSMYIWNTTATRYITQKGLKAEEGLDATFKNFTLPEAAEYFKMHYGLTESKETIIDEINGMTEDAYRNEVKAKDGLPVLLEYMQSKGIKMCVATVTDRYLAEIALKRAGIRQFFDEIFTCSEIGAGKHEPKIYETALTFLGVPKEEVLVFEDAHYAITTAKNAGFSVVGIFDESYAAKWQETKDLADFAVVSYRKSFEKWSERYEKSTDDSGL